MKIAVTAKGAGLGAWLDPDFIACKFFVIVEGKKDFSTIENRTLRKSESDEKSLVQELINNGIDILVTGHISQPSVNILKSNGVLIFSADMGSVLELVEKAENGNLILLK